MRLISVKRIIFQIFFVCACVLYGARVYSQDATREPLQGLDEIYLITTRIEMFIANTRLGTATGFFFRVRDSGRTFLITNRHVVVDEKEKRFPDRLKLWLHLDRTDLRRNDYYDVALYNDIERKQKRWAEINPDVDVVAIELPNRDLEKFRISAFTSSDFAPIGTQVFVGEPVAIIGYPEGFSDTLHNLPVSRQGAIASAFAVPFMGKPLFLVDAILHPGTSGSPVITRPDVTRITSTGQLVFGRQYYLVGINSGSFGALNLNAIWLTSIIAELVK
jgi:S1-C subfamily serine protease